MMSTTLFVTQRAVNSDVNYFNLFVTQRAVNSGINYFICNSKSGKQ